eukprot:3109582-Rhodomonas_salina.1
MRFCAFPVLAALEAFDLASYGATAGWCTSLCATCTARASPTLPRTPTRPLSPYATSCIPSRTRISAGPPNAIPAAP